jgi:AcrR family transcriptional regulator
VPSPARGLTQPERVQHSAQRLLAAAAELIVEKGWEAATAAEIGRRAGYSRAMVHARFGNKESMLDVLLEAYVGRLNPDPDPRDDGLTQVLAHFDRIDDLHRRDPDLLRAMFVAAFEAAKTTSPLRPNIRLQLESAATKVRAGLHNGVADGSIRPEVDIDRAVADVTAAVFGIAFHWVVMPDHDLERELQDTRARIIGDYGSAPPE